MRTDMAIPMPRPSLHRQVPHQDHAARWIIARPSFSSSCVARDTGWHRRSDPHSDTFDSSARADHRDALLGDKAPTLLMMTIHGSSEGASAKQRLAVFGGEPDKTRTVGFMGTMTFPPGTMLRAPAFVRQHPDFPLTPRRS